MLIPLRTDAPLYHGPWATIALIVINLVVHIWATATRYEYVDPYLVEFGVINPLQWFTSIFLHLGWMHLIGNMVFLWVFGQVVEGKIGWWRFLVVYGVIAVVGGFIEQLIMLGAEGGSLGASGVIFGLMAISLIWAPDNEVDCLLLLGIFVKTFEMRIITFAGIYLALNILEVALSGLHVSSGLLHLLGVVAGLPVGIVMLRRGWVDCEQWDWFSRRARHSQPAKAPVAKPVTKPAPRPAPIKAKPVPAVADVPAAPIDPAAIEQEFRTSFSELMEAEQLDAAITIWHEHGRGWSLPIDQRARLAEHLLTRGRTKDAQVLIDSVMQDEPTHAAMGLRQADLLLDANRPAAAEEVLARIAPYLSDATHRTRHQNLTDRAASRKNEGVLELDL